MDAITKEQYEALQQGELHPTLPDHIKSDITYVKTILLTTEGAEYYVQYVELDELCEAEIRDIMTSGSDFIRMSV
tara:strand:+ start:544 stop:768 length:225 start_codon:yes stop_codon:yes gene_type:complete